MEVLKSNAYKIQNPEDGVLLKIALLKKMLQEDAQNADIKKQIDITCSEIERWKGQLCFTPTLKNTPPDSFPEAENLANIVVSHDNVDEYIADLASQI